MLEGSRRHDGRSEVCRTRMCLNRSFSCGYLLFIFGGGTFTDVTVTFSYSTSFGGANPHHCERYLPDQNRSSCLARSPGLRTPRRLSSW